MAERTAHHIRVLPALLALVALTALAVLVTTAAPDTADARKVAGTSGPANTVPIRLESRPTGPATTFIRIRRRNGTATVGEPAVLDYQALSPIVFAGTIAGNSNATFTNVTFPSYQYDSNGTVVDIFIEPTGNFTGTLNPLDGSASIVGPVRIRVVAPTPLGNSTCSVTTTINALISGADPEVAGLPYSDPNFPHPTQSGSPYVPATGRTTIIDNDATVPAFSNCSGLVGGTVNGELNAQLALPADPGDVDLQFEMEAQTSGGNVRPQPALLATVTSAQSTTAPYTRDYDATGSGLAPGTTGTTVFYDWDWDNNGSVDQTTTTPTVSHNFGSSGTKTIRLTVRDAEGDTRSTTNTANVAEPPDLSVVKTASDPRFTVGKAGSYTLQVRNEPLRGPTLGTTTVTDNVPASLEIISVGAPGWSCNTATQTVTCTRAATLNGGESAAPIVIGVRPRQSGANTTAINTATVSTPADVAPVNNSSTTNTPIDFVDLSIQKSAPGPFTLGTVGTYTINVTNVGSGGTFGPVTVVDELPAGLTYRSASGDWTCSNAGQQVTCTANGPIAGGASSPLTLSVFVEPSGEAFPAVANTALVQTTGDNNPLNNTSNVANTDVLANPDVAITKSTAGAFRVGTNGEYLISVRNAAPAAAAGATATGPITVTDTLPAGLTYAGFTGAGWSCSATGQDVTCEHPDPIAPQTGAPALAIQVAVAASAPATVSNTAEVEIPESNGEVSLENNTSTVTHAVNRIDLQVLKTSDSGFQVGNTGQYNVRVRNVGTAPTFAPITVTDTLPAGLSFNPSGSGGAGFSCSASGQDVTCTRTTPLAPGPNADVTIRVNVDDAGDGTAENTATAATQDDVDTSNNTDDVTTPVTSVDLSLTKAHTGDFLVGANGTWALTVQNISARPTTGDSTVVDTLPAGVDLVSAGDADWACDFDTPTRQLTCVNDAVLQPGDVSSFEVEVSVPTTAPASVTNTATVSTDQDTNQTNDTASDPTTINRIDVAIDKSHTGDFRSADRGTYTIDVTNEGTAPTRGTTIVTDALPADMTFVDSGGTNWDCSADANQVVTCEHTGSIPANGSAEPLTLTVDVGGDARNDTNTATVATNIDVDAGNDSAADPTTVTQTDIDLVKTAVGAFRAGEGASYAIDVTNTGSAATRGGVQVTDILPTGLTFVRGTGTGWSCEATGQTVTCSLSDEIAANGDATTLTIDVRVLTTAPGSLINAAFAGTSGDPDTPAASDDVTTNVDGAIDLTVDKSHSGDFRAGDVGTYRYGVRNIGALPTTGATTVTDTLSEGLTVAATRGAGWDCSASDGRNVSCERSAALPENATAPALEVDVTVADDAPSALNSTATVSTAGDAAAANDTDDDPTTVGRIDLSIVKNYPDRFAEGGTSSYTLDVRNNGSIGTVGTVRITDEFPKGINPIVTLSGDWDCSTSGGRLTCDRSALAAGTDAPRITVLVSVGSEAVPSVTGTARVATTDDVRADNDTSTDTAAVTAKPAPPPPPPPPPPVAPPPPPPKQTLTITTRGTVYVPNSRTIAVQIYCRASSARGCSGRLSLRPRPSPVPESRAAANAFRAGPLSFRVPVGKTGTARVKVSAEALRQLRRRGPRWVLAEAHIAGRAGRAAYRSIKLRAPKP